MNPNEQERGLTPEQQQELDEFLHNNPGDEGRASRALGFDTSGGGYTPNPVVPGSSDHYWDGDQYVPIPTGNAVNAPTQNTSGGGTSTTSGTGNPRDDMIVRDKASWEAYLKQQLGALYDPTTLQSAVANVSYAQNAGRDPKQILDGIIAKEKLRLTDTPDSTYTPSATPWGGGSLTKPVVPPVAAPRPAPALTSFNQFSSGTAGGWGAGSGGSNLLSGGTWATSPLEHLPQSQPIAPFTGTYSFPEFAPPTLEEARNSPGFQLQLQEAQKAIERSSAAKGSLLTPNNLRGLQDYTIGASDANYGNVFGQKYTAWNANRGNAADIFGTNRDVFNTNESNRFGSETTNQNTAFNQLNTNRNFDFSVNRDAFDRSQTGYLNSFDAYKYANDSYWKNLYNTAALGRPSGA